MATAAADISLLAPGARVEVRDENWLITQVHATKADGLKVRALGLSELVRDQEATFFTTLDDVRPQRPQDTQLVLDKSPAFRQSRVFLDALLRRTPLPVTVTAPAVGHRQLLDEVEYQKRAVAMALEQPRPRLLIADAVGLGKTLEVGMILSELIRRGRGERILVVTPRHILEQFQHELWTRFAIPLVRLDSEGIQRVRQKIPPTRNPFTYYKRAIISIDTLKSVGKYSHHLERVQWDAVVIDECHNVANRSALRNRVARLLAPRTDALLLTSATPHNGRRESFAELIRMLDPTAIADPAKYEHKDIEHLYVRRFKKDVAAEVGHQFPERRPPEALLVATKPAEEAVVAELAATWLYPGAGGAPVSGKGSRLFPWTLVKAFLSSHVALAETIANRRRKIAKERPDDVQREENALKRLADLVAAIDDGTASKLARLVEELKRAGVGRSSATRVVVFSERRATLGWLERTLPALLRLPQTAIHVLHAGLADTDQMDIVEEFGQAESDVRLLLTGDVASEGVNLHRACHHLVHFDLPWSIIRIDQRNGRIDRYGQTSRPEIRALVVTPAHEKLRGDLTVLRRLLEREHEVHRTLGEAAALMGLHDAKREEDAILSALAHGRPLEETVPDTPTAEGFDMLALLAGSTSDAPVETMTPLTLTADDAEFVEEALRACFEDPEHDLDLRRDPKNSLLSLVPPADLRRRLNALPQDYLSEQKILDRLQLTTDRDVAFSRLAAARDSGTSMWPDTGYLTAQHPVVEWLIDKVLAGYRRNEAPVLVGAVEQPVVLLQGMCSNAKGQPTVVEWMGVGADLDVQRLRDVIEVASLGPGMPNPAVERDLTVLEALVEPAVSAARAHVVVLRGAREQHLNAMLAEAAERAQAWEQLTLEIAGSEKERRHASHVRSETDALIERLHSTGDPLIRVIGAIIAPA